jgi:HD-like signal output (HDOD) protein
MKKVLFVDDDPGVIHGLKRMMRSLRNEWQMDFVLSGQEALDKLAQSSFDVIISDMRMPGMNGAELLTRVREKYPHMVRIILSGYSEQDLLLKAVRPAHQFLSKPCSPDTLKATVKRISDLHDILHSEKIRNVISQADSLPSQPNLYSAIMAKLQDEDVSIKDVALIIQKDVGMTAEILKLVNSSFFGFFKNISSPVQACTLLGLNTVKTLVLSIEIFSMLQARDDIGFSFQDLWDHSILTGVFAKHIAKEITDDAAFIEQAFMAGFLHDIGILVLASKLPEKYKKVLELARQNQISIWDAEYEILDSAHPEVGAYLLGLWGFADNIIEAIAKHHQPQVFGDEPKSLITVLHAADAFARKLQKSDQNLILAKFDIKYYTDLDLIDQSKKWFGICEEVFKNGES